MTRPAAGATSPLRPCAATRCATVAFHNRLVNVLYDAQIFRQQRYGGISRYFAELAPRIGAMAGVKARILAPGHDNAYLADVGGKTLVGWRRNALAGRVRGGRRAERVLVRATESVARSVLRADVVHETYYVEAPPAARGAVRALTVYDMIHERFAALFDGTDPTSRAKRAAIARADLVFCISESTRRDLIELFEVPAAKLVVTYLSANLAPAANAPAAGGDREPYVLYVGERRGYKNFLGLVEAMQASPLLRSLPLVCFGGGPLSAEERGRIDAIGFPVDRISHAFGDDTQLARLYGGALCFVYPSLYEGFGIPPLEAMRCGCPVVCSNTSSIPEVVGAAGEYFDPNDVGSIAQAIESVIGSESRRHELKTLGFAQTDRFSWDRCAAQTFAAYRAAMGGA